jgi:lincosamide nucleotidyltransferase A/C/D/E
VITAGDLLEIVGTFEGAGLWYSIDGGWGVDALAGEKTRQHSDLDLVVRCADLDRCREALDPLGFRHDDGSWPGLPARCVLRDRRGRQVDLHPIVRDGDGNGWQLIGDDAWGLYPHAELDARGSVAGRPVTCVGAMLQLRHHLGFEWNEAHRHDLRLLGERFGIPLPPRIDTEPPGSGG